ncbi:MAG: TetR/AcrR family transcriptional regulator [Novosphingobium sp.]|nr:TetR/AcrR family transcriptional regulator [Novosphingobium sp.]MCP5401422.1 TetR/AcrR family transcriptional regulator [Novosphingobium sp.]
MAKRDLATSDAPTVRRKRRSPEELNSLILEAAAREFGENGYSGATTAAIARRADVTEAQIFRFFPSKAELFREAIFRPLNRHFSEFHSRNLADSTDAETSNELARRYINELQDFMGEHSRMLMSLIVASAYEQDTSGRLTDIEGLRAYFERGAALMESRTPGEPKVAHDLMVRVSFAAVLASVMFKDWLFPPGLANDEEIRQAIADFTIEGIRANEQPGL